MRRTIPVPPVPHITGPITVTFHGTTYRHRRILGWVVTA